MGGVLLDPISAVIGIISSLALEVLLLGNAERTRALWNRPAVQAAGVVATLGAGMIAWAISPRLFAVIVWGLLAYLGLLVIVSVLGANPLVRFRGQS